MENLHSLNLEDLHKMQAAISAEIKRRKNESKLTLYMHDCKGSAKYHMGKYKHWAKLVRAADTTKTDGYAFVGDFLNVNHEHKLPVGSIVVETCGSEIRAYRITDDWKDEIDRSRTNSMSDLIEKIAKEVESN